MSKALIIIDHGSTVEEANNMLRDITDKLRTHPRFNFDMVEHCHMELASPTLEDALLECVNKGASEITVHPYFLAPGRHSKTDIPNMVNVLKSRYPDIKFKISEPLGLHENMLDVILERSNSC